MLTPSEPTGRGPRNGVEVMSVLAYVGLTVALFAMFTGAVRLLER
ncbi:hypothetical protein MYVA_2411 [Mycolicibacterium vaccae 95051]|nr:hypothetical protein MYVA_2411 [Mycolicibacterium vaccae 95051]